MSGKVRTKNTDVVAPKRRRLTDLFITGKELEFDDGSGEEPIKLWLSKISPVENRDSADNATKARARILSLKFLDPSDPEVAVYKEQIEDLGVNDRQSRIDFLISPKLQEAFLSAQARIASEEPWSKDEYLESLQKAWNDSIAEKYDEDPEDPEAKRIYDQLKKFSDEVEEALEDDRKALTESFEHYTDEELEQKALQRAIEAESDFAWVNEFSRWQIYYAVREIDDHDVRYFTDRNEVDMVDPDIVNQLISEYRDLTVDAFEGKDSEETPSS